MPCRGLIILIFDTLRTDFQSICLANRISTLPAFNRLRSLTQPLFQARCGSFPTVPMRTDLLTGRLAFLYRRWARPLDTDPVFTRIASRNGIHTTLITDNYMMAVPALGGTFGDFFDECVFIRGSGFDPWQKVKGRDISASPQRPVWCPVPEQQFLANLKAYKSAGGPPWDRLFRKAVRVLEQKIRCQKQRFLLWIDCFSTHEPWVLPDQFMNGNFADDEPITPPYGSASAYTVQQLTSLRRQYVARIAAVDQAMDSFTHLIKDVLRSGDVALAVLSDHGFLFGEYGFVGKPVEAPVLPPLHDLVVWLSPHFEDRVDFNAPLQPHDFSTVFCEILGISFPGNALNHNLQDRPQVIGRNSPAVQTLTIATSEGFVLVFRDEMKCPPKWFPWIKLDTSVSWEIQGDTEVPGTVLQPLQLQEILGQKPWIANFKASLECLMGVAL